MFFVSETSQSSRAKKFRKVMTDTLKSVLLTTVVYTILWYFAHGIPLAGLPGEENIARITVSFDDHSHETADPEDIHLARSLANCLNYKVLGKAQGEPLITITYYLVSGEEISVSANETTVWWRGKPHPLYDDNTFVNLTRGVFSGD